MTSLEQTLFKIRTTLLEVSVIKEHHEAIEKKTHVKIEYLAVGFGLILALSLFSGLGAGLISDLIGFAYPSYMTLKAIESKETTDDTEWLMYWVVFATLFLVENFLEWVLYWIPHYYALKVTFLLWCMLPRYQGAKFVYQTVFEPLYKKHSSAIDAALNSTSNKEKTT